MNTVMLFAEAEEPSAIPGSAAQQIVSQADTNN
jgi:hypothetical protein